MKDFYIDFCYFVNITSRRHGRLSSYMKGAWIEWEISELTTPWNICETGKIGQHREVVDRFVNVTTRRSKSYQASAVSVVV